MKKLLLSLLAVMISLTALAQTKGDKLTINLKNGKTEAWDLTADGKHQQHLLLYLSRKRSRRCESR